MNLDFDLSKVNRENFYDVVAPVAKAEATVTMYDFAGGAYPLLSSTGVVGNVALTKILPNMDHYDPVLAGRILRADLMAAGMGKICPSPSRPTKT